MGELARVLGSEGPGFTVEALGKTWRLTTASQRIKAEFEQWLEDQAENLIRDRREARGEESYAEEMDAFRDRRDAGHYRWKGPMFVRRMRNGTGCAQLLMLLLRKHHPKVTLEEVEALVEAAPTDVIDVLKRVIDDAPNSQPPEKPGEPTAD